MKTVCRINVKTVRILSWVKGRYVYIDVADKLGEINAAHFLMYLLLIWVIRQICSDVHFAMLVDDNKNKAE